MKQLDYFSNYGSYLSFKRKENDLIMHTKHGSAKMSHHSEVFHISIDADQKTDLAFPVSEIRSDSSRLGITFAGRKTAVLRAEGSGLEVSLDLKPRSKYDYVFEIYEKGISAFVVNSYSTLTKYLVYSADAQIGMEQNYEGDLYRYPDQLISKLKIRSEKDVFTLFIQEIEHNMEAIHLPERKFEEYAAETENRFHDFCKDFRIPKAEWKDDVEYAAYILFSSTIGKAGIQKRDLVVAANEMMNCVWAFDSGFPAYALAKTHSELALNQILAFYDFQDEEGCIPGSMEDSNLRWSFLKPPGQGMFLKRILSASEIKKEDLEYAYQGLKKQVAFWRNRKDMNQDGICEYHHGNESCLDNATIFDEGFPVDSPDLTAYLVEDLDCLSLIAEKLDRKEESRKWEKEADFLSQKALDFFVEDGLPYARKTPTGEKIVSDSIMPFTLLQLRKRIPEKLSKNWIKILEKEFLCEYGLASEKINSSKFEENGYFRGSVFHYYTVPLVDALADVSENDLAEKIAERYCRAFVRSGSSECFNPINGEGQHVPGFTSAAGTFLYFCEKYLK